jgi:hypothetical protein
VEGGEFFFFLSVDELFEFVLLKIEKSRFSAVDEFKQKPLLFPTIAAQKNGLIIHMVPSIGFRFRPNIIR